MPEKRSFPIWDVVQALAGVYCAFIGTASWLYPQQVNQPRWQFWNSVRVTVPPLWATGFALAGVALMGKAITDFVKDRRARRLADLPPPEPKLKIHSAWYGTNSANDLPVGDFLNSYSKEALSIRIDNNLVAGRPDPAPNAMKRLVLEYSFGSSETKKIERPEHTHLVLPEDPFLMELAKAALQERDRYKCDLVAKLASKQDEIAEMEQRYSTRWQERLRETIRAAIVPEVRRLIDDLERIKDWNERERPEFQVSLLYPLKGDQIGERDTWKWQQEHLVKWHVSYQRLLDLFQRLGLNSSLPPLGSPITLSALIRQLSEIERGEFVAAQPSKNGAQV